MNFRTAFRYKTMRDGTIVLVGGGTIKCSVRDISTKGARLELGSSQKIPEEFFLLIQRQSERFRCFRVWQKDRLVGVQYT